MTYSFMELDESHGLQLLQLSNESSTGSNLFYVDRSPNFFKLSEEFGKTRHFGLFKGSALIGCVAVSQQKRVIEGACKHVYYLNDLRIHPDFHRTFAYFRLTQQLVSLYQNEGAVKWMYSTVLDTNSNKASMIKGNGLLPSGIELGRTFHIGVPMFFKYRNNHLDVFEIEGEEAWQIYKSFATSKDFALYDKKIFLKDNGVFLVIRDQKDDLAICKLVNQSDARKLRLSRRLPFLFKIVNLICRAVGCPPLPDKREEFQHGYLAFFTARETPKRYRQKYISYIQKTYKHRFTYLFFGVSSEEVEQYRCNPFYIKHSSTTFAYGDIPANLSMDFHEITLI